MYGCSSERPTPHIAYMNKVEKMERNNIDDEQLTEIFKEYLAQGYSKEEIEAFLKQTIESEKEIC